MKRVSMSEEEIKKLKEDINKLINYIAIKENLDYKEVVRKFAILDERID